MWVRPYNALDTHRFWRSALNSTHAGKQATKSTCCIILRRVKFNSSSLGLDFRTRFIEFLLSFRAQSAGLVLHIVGSRVEGVEAVGNLAGGPFVNWRRNLLNGGLATEWSCGMEDIVQCALRGEEERHLGWEMTNAGVSDLVRQR